MIKISRWILIFFDVTNKGSLNNINYYFDETKKNNDINGIIFLRNKIDNNDKRVISKQKANEIGEEKGT